MARDYVLVVQGAAHALSPTRFALDSAFAEHLQLLRARLGDSFDRLVLIGPALDPADYPAKAAQWRVLDAERDAIAFVPAAGSIAAQWRQLQQVARQATVVQADLATDVRRPLTALAALAAWRVGTLGVFVVDVDFRRHASRFRQIGYWGWRQYAMHRLVQEPFKRLQVAAACRFLPLVLLKSAGLVRDFGRGRGSVKDFFDTVHAAGDLIDPATLAARAAAGLRGPLRLCHFGRLVPYKGVDRMIEAVRLARAQGADVALTIIGAGSAEAAMRQQAAGLGAAVNFVPPAPYGPALFALLAEQQVMLAAPLIEDTPRSAFDAMARGLGIIAFDIAYFRDLAASGAVDLAAWPKPEALAARIVALDGDRARLAAMMRAGRAFAAENTQQIWLDRRVGWITERLAPATSDAA